MSQTKRHCVIQHALTMSSQALACLLTGLYLAGSVLTATAAQPLVPPPPDFEARAAQGEARALLSLEMRFRQFDDHYAIKTAEMKQRIQEALAAAKQAPSAAEVAALKATIGRLEAQVTRLTAGTTRTEGALTGVTARIETIERAQTERAAKETAATAVLPPGAALKTEKSEKPVEPTDAGFNEALAGLHGPKETTEPIRRWLELYPTHPEAAEGYLQLGFYLLNQHQPVMAAYYLKHLIAAYPMNLQAQEAKNILSSLSLADAPKPKVSPKKIAKSSIATIPKPAAVSPAPKNDKALSKSEDTTPIAAPAIDPPTLPHHEAEKLGPASSAIPVSPVVPRATSKKTEGPITMPFFAPPPLDLPLKPTLPTRSHADEKS